MKSSRTLAMLGLTCCLGLAACGGTTAKSNAIDACIGMRMVNSLLSSGSTDIEKAILDARVNAASAAELDPQTFSNLSALIQKFPTTVTAANGAAIEVAMKQVSAECTATGYIWS